MANVLVQLLGLFALLGLATLGYWHWIRRLDIGIQGKGLLLLTIFTFVGGLLGSTGWWIDDPRSFPWDLPPLASRMLASAGLAFGVATFVALQRPTYRHMRLVLLMLATYLTPLLIAILLFHIERFDLSAPITYAFFAIVLLLDAPTLWYLYRQPIILPNTPDESLPPSPLARVWLGVVAIVTALWGLMLFITDNGPSAFIWVWRNDLLTTRLIAVMLLTIAIGAVYSLRYADVSRVMLGVIAVYGFGVSLSNLWNLLASRPVNLSYVVAFSIMFLISTVLLIVERQNIVESSDTAR